MTGQLRWAGPGQGLVWWPDDDANVRALSSDGSDHPLGMGSPDDVAEWMGEEPSSDAAW